VVTQKEVHMCINPPKCSNIIVISYLLDENNSLEKKNVFVVCTYIDCV
jgi:hypothetical protein